MTFYNLFDLFLSWFKPRSKAPLSKPISTTTIIVRVGDKVVGAISSISIEEYRPYNDATRAASSNKITANRIRFDRARIAEAFSRGFIHKNSQIYPLQIEVIDEKAKTTIQNAWIDEDVGFSYMTNDWIIVDCIKLIAEKIFSKKK